MSILNQPYRERAVLSIIKNLIPSFKINKRGVSKTPRSFQKVINLGLSKKLGNLYVFAVKSSISLGQRRRLADDVFGLMLGSGVFRSLVVFYADNTKKWRLALFEIKPKIQKNNKIVNRESDYSRFSYLLGPDENITTPFNQIIDNKEPIRNWQDLFNRFIYGL